jgi:tRNA (guanine37-N1)-methyltransferase
LIDAIARQIPGVLGCDESAARESFRNGLLEAPQFTRPRELANDRVPAVLLSGHHRLIEDWQSKISWLVTWQKRPDLAHAKRTQLGPQEQRQLQTELLRLWQDLSGEDRSLLQLDDRWLKHMRAGSE